MDAFERMSRALGLRPVVFGLFLLIDWLFFSGEALTLGGLEAFFWLPTGVMFVAALVLQKDGGDGLPTAFAKALVLAFLTAVPTGVFSAVVAIGAFLTKSRNT